MMWGQYLRARGGFGTGDRGDVTCLQRTRFAFGMIGTPKTQRGFTPGPFPIHPSSRYIAHRETIHRGSRGMC